MGLSKFLSQIPVIKNLFDYTAVPVIRMSGIISEGQGRRQTLSFEKYQKIIEKAFDIAASDEEKKSAVGFVINSPGGSPAQSILIADQIRAMAEKKKVRSYAFVEDVAASGGYWLACACDEIYSTAGSIVGSIGVISASFGFQEIIAKYGIERRVYASGKDKSFLDPFMPVKPRDLERLKTLQTDIHDQFKNWVKNRRGEKLKGKEAELFEGQFWTGEKAKDIGIIDGIGNFNRFFTEKFGEKTLLLDLQPEKKLFSLPGIMGAQSRMSGEVIMEALEAMEEKSLWQRYGL